MSLPLDPRPRVFSFGVLLFLEFSFHTVILIYESCAFLDALDSFCMVCFLALLTLGLYLVIFSLCFHFQGLLIYLHVLC